MEFKLLARQRTCLVKATCMGWIYAMHEDLLIPAASSHAVDLSATVARCRNQGGTRICGPAFLAGGHSIIMV